MTKAKAAVVELEHKNNFPFPINSVTVVYETMLTLLKWDPIQDSTQPCLKLSMSLTHL